MKLRKTFAVGGSALLLFIGSLCYFSANWYITTYGDIGFDAIISTLFASLGGLETDLLISYLLSGLLPCILFTALLVTLIFARSDRHVVLRSKKWKITVYPFRKNYVSVIVSAVLSLVFLVNAATYSGFVRFLIANTEYSTLFEEKYVEPTEDIITFPEEKRNLIYIYMESMETAFLAKELGGANENLVIPELYDLAVQNVNFSHNSGVGGFTATSGSTNSIAALVSQSSGVPLKTPFDVGNNDYGSSKSRFLPGLTTLSDILHKNGYSQAFMIGSDASFAGQRELYEQHGTDMIYDHTTARKDGIIPDDYYVWWGMEDKYLYEYAKQELTELASGSQPFAFTMMTIDTHHVGGYPCSLCRSRYDEQYENVYACASRQVAQFIAWIQDQEFYKNTTIVICGDHPSMDAQYFERNVEDSYDRTVYNCFINAAVSSENTKNRAISTVDMFPTTLAALGCTIEGDRLGLGTNLFSSTPTLAEEMGMETLNHELAKNSKYYMRNFFRER